MWEVIVRDDAADTTHRYYVTRGHWTVGREGTCAIILPQPFVSRMHANLIVAGDDECAQGERIAYQNVSKAGSHVGTEHIKSTDGAPVRLQDGASVLIGTRGANASKQVTLMVRHVPLKLVLSLVDDKTVLERLHVLAAQLGAVLCKAWDDDATHVVMGRTESSTKFLRALLTGKPIVTPHWVEQLAARRTAGEALPSEADFMPVFEATSQGSRAKESGSTITQIWEGANLSAALDRRVCFAGITLVWERHSQLCELVETVHHDVMWLSGLDGVLVPDVAARVSGSEAAWRSTAGGRPGVVVRYASKESATPAVKALISQLRSFGFSVVPETDIVAAILHAKPLLEVVASLRAAGGSESQASQASVDAAAPRSEVPAPAPSSIAPTRARLLAPPVQQQYDKPVSSDASLSRISATPVVRADTSSAQASSGKPAAGVEIVDLSQDDEIPVRRRQAPAPAVSRAKAVSIAPAAIVQSMDISVDEDSDVAQAALVGGSMPAPSDLFMSAPSQRSASVREDLSRARSVLASAKSITAPAPAPMVTAAAATAAATHAAAPVPDDAAPGVDVSILRDGREPPVADDDDTAAPEKRLMPGVWTRFGRHARARDPLAGHALLDVSAADTTPHPSDADAAVDRESQAVVARYYEEDIEVAKRLRMTRVTAHPVTATSVPAHLKRYYAPPPHGGPGDMPTNGKVFRKVPAMVYVPVHAASPLQGDAVNMIDDEAVVAELDAHADEQREEQREDDDMFRVAGTAAGKGARAAAKASHTLAILSSSAPAVRGKRNRILREEEDDDEVAAPAVPEERDRTPVNIVEFTAKRARMSDYSTAATGGNASSRSVQRRAPSASVMRQLPAGAAAVPRIEALAAQAVQRAVAAAQSTADGPATAAPAAAASTSAMPPPPPRPRPVTQSVARRR